MYDGLVEGLRKTHERIKKIPGLANYVPSYQLSAAADAIEELSASIECYEANTIMTLIEEDGCMAIRFMPKWIPVTERLPEDGSDILGYLQDAEHKRFMAANYDKGYWQDCVTGLLHRTEDGFVTHWMPLPKPPTEG